MDNNLESSPSNVEIAPDAVPEAMPGEVLGESVAADTAEQIVPSNPITIEGEINSIDNAIADAEAMNTNTREQLSALRQELGLPDTQEEPPSIQSENEEIAQLKQQRKELTEQRNKDGDEMMDPSEELEEEPELSEENKQERKKEELQLRKKSIEQFKKDVTEKFEQDLRSDFEASKALNIEQAVQMMKARLSETLNESAKEFVSGKTNVPPFPAGVEMHWETYVRPESKFDEPNWITKLNVIVDNRVIEIASERDMNKEEGTKILDAFASKANGPSESKEDPQGASDEDDIPEKTGSKDGEITSA